MNENSRSRRLKEATRDTHDRLDKSIMAEDIFASQAQFARFLRVQYRFHRDVDALYTKPELVPLLPELDARRRLAQVTQDLHDLDIALPAAAAGKLDGNTALPEALGWLYVAEGSNIGGTVLYKLASSKLGLNAEHGARHLAAHPDGAARHWREFTQALDEITLSEDEEARVFAAANQAFATVQGYVNEEFGKG
ncbi:biliverdin-producing heme oxygenase [Lysobacteraceae bacterium NML120232]|nr:biliverdin-producing heme oxygenase [Xanthomonadaceae bacterium NML08-0793]PJK09691.1 biliverdin-producing heme oxygenase [Xanthomonadaceae bacterium NML120232]